jgi:hypothetical protein
VKKFIAVCAVGLWLSATLPAEQPDGWGISLSFGGTISAIGDAGGLGGTIALKILPLPLYLGISLGSNGIGVTGDYYFFDQSLIFDIRWYVGAGGGFMVWFPGEGANGFALNMRVPAGISWNFISNWEIFLEIALQTGPQFVPKFNWNLSFPLGLGLRYRF